MNMTEQVRSQIDKKEKKNTPPSPISYTVTLLNCI